MNIEDTDNITLTKPKGAKRFLKIILNILTCVTLYIGLFIMVFNITGEFNPKTIIKDYEYIAIAYDMENNNLLIYEFYLNSSG